MTDRASQPGRRRARGPAGTPPFRQIPNVATISPAEFARGRAEARRLVREHFDSLAPGDSAGVLKASGDRVLLARAESLSVGFVDYFAGGGRATWSASDFHAAGSTLYALARSLGMRDARHLGGRFGTADATARMFLGVEYFEATGWAHVELVESASSSSGGDDVYSVFDHVDSFEAEAWLARRAAEPAAAYPPGPACFLSGGYAAGWMLEITGRAVDTREIFCRTQGDPACRFVAGSPEFIEQHVHDYLTRHRARPQ